MTDASGTYALTVSPGTYSLQIGDQQLQNTPYNVPSGYYVLTPTFSVLQNTMLDITIPARKVSVHVQDPNGQPVVNVSVFTPQNVSISSVNLGILSGSGNNLAQNPRVTDNSGNAVLWLLFY